MAPLLLLAPAPERVAGAIAGLAGFATFLILHHAWIVPIWQIAPVGAIVSIFGGVVVGTAYGELRPRVPRRPWTSIGVLSAAVGVLTPAIVLAHMRGPIYAIGHGGPGTLLVPVSDAAIAIGLDLLATAVVAGGLLGMLVGRTPRAAATTAAAGAALALGPGHNIPFFGGTAASAIEGAVLLLVAAVASVTLVEADHLLRRRRLDAIPAG